jgi:hypothetical protein
MTPVEVLSYWQRIKTLTFSASSQAASGWSGHGRGAVTTLRDSALVLVWHECGTWYPQHSSPLNFRNCYRWTAKDATLQLEHLRFGPERPVLLFDIWETDQGNWQQLQPHVCGRDTYSAEMVIANHRISLTWFVNGPQKAETIAYEYFESAEDATAK